MTWAISISILLRYFDVTECHANYLYWTFNNQLPGKLFCISETLRFWLKVQAIPVFRNKKASFIVIINTRHELIQITLDKLKLSENPIFNTWKSRVSFEILRACFVQQVLSCKFDFASKFIFNLHFSRSCKASLFFLTRVWVRHIPLLIIYCRLI